MIFLWIQASGLVQWACHLGVIVPLPNTGFIFDTDESVIEFPGSFLHYPELPGACLLCRWLATDVELRTMRTIGSVKEKAARKRDDEDNDLYLGSLAGWGGEIGLPIMSVMTNSNSLVLHWAPQKPPLHLYTLRLIYDKCLHHLILVPIYILICDILMDVWNKTLLPLHKASSNLLCSCAGCSEF